MVENCVPAFVDRGAHEARTPLLDALAAQAGKCVVFVTITIDARGTVTEVLPTWQRLSIPNRFSDEFLDAVKVAVRSWRFKPARIVYWEKTGNDDLSIWHGDDFGPDRRQLTSKSSGKVQ